MKAVWFAKAPLYLTVKHVQKAKHVELMGIIFVKITFNKSIGLAFANHRILITRTFVLRFRTEIGFQIMK